MDGLAWLPAPPEIWSLRQMKIPPRVQMWIGAVGSLLFLLRVIVTITNPMATADWIEAYSAFCAASLFAGMAWRGYQPRAKTGRSREI